MPDIKNFLLFILLVAAGLELGGVLSLWSGDGLYRDALIDRYYVPARHLQSNLQKVASYGVNPIKSTGLARDLKGAQQILDEQFAAHDARVVEEAKRPVLLIVSPAGQVLYRGDGKTDAAPLSESQTEALLTPNAPGEAASAIRYVAVEGGYAIPLKIHDRGSNWIGSVVVLIDDAPIDAQSHRLLKDCLAAINGFYFIALPVYALLLMLMLSMQVHPAAFGKRRVFWFTVGFAVLVQVWVGIAVGLAYQNDYETTARDKTQILASLMRTDAESALARGVRLEDLDFSHYPWQRLATEFRALGAVDVHDAEGTLVARVSRQGVEHFPHTVDAQATAQFTETFATTHTLTQKGETVGFLRVRLSAEALDEIWIDLVGDSLAANMVIVLILVELILLFRLYADPSVRRRAPTTEEYFGVMRPAIFIFVFGVDLSMSFVPLHMEVLYEPVLGLSKDFVLGLPISVEFLCVGISILFAGVWVDRVNWRQPFLVGIALAGAAALYSWLAPTVYHFVFSRAILGFGIGLTLLASQGFVITYAKTTSKTMGLAQLFAALYGGSICGSVTGAMLAERLGFSTVFLIGAIVVCLSVLYVVTMLPPAPARASSERGEVRDPIGDAAGHKPLYGFLSNRVMIGLILFSSLPASIAAVGFLYYFSPIYLNRIGASQSVIGQVLMLYGVCMVFIGPWISRRVDTPPRKRLAVFCGCILGGAAFLSFAVFDGLAAAAITVLLLGISHSVVLSSQSAYALSLKATVALGEGKAMGIFRSSGRIGQMLGPLAFGWVIAASDVEQGMVIIGCAYLVMAALFWLMTLKDRQMLAV